MYEEEMFKVSNLYFNLKGSTEFTIPKMFILTRLNPGTQVSGGYPEFQPVGPGTYPVVTLLCRL